MTIEIVRPNAAGVYTYETLDETKPRPETSPGEELVIKIGADGTTEIVPASESEGG
jgi:hypothetical protein